MLWGGVTLFYEGGLSAFFTMGLLVRQWKQSLILVLWLEVQGYWPRPERSDPTGEKWIVIFALASPTNNTHAHLAGIRLQTQQGHFVIVTKQITY